MIQKLNKQNLVWTAHGPDYGEVKSLGGFGEVIFNEQDGDFGTASQITKGKRGVDNIPTNVEETDNNGILSATERDWRDGQTFADKGAQSAAEIEQTNNKLNMIRNNKLSKLSSNYKNTLRVAQGEAGKIIQPRMQHLTELSNQQGLQKQYKEKAKNYAGLYENQTAGLERFEGGTIPWGQRAIPNIIGLGNSLLQLHHYATEPINYHSTYVNNPYERQVIEGLGGLRQNIYPQLRGVYDAERRGQYNVSKMGGLTGGQRAANRVALALGTQRNVADVIAANQAANINLKSNYYKTMADLGQNQRTARMSAAQHDWANYIAAHGAKTRGIEQAMANLQSAAGNWYQNEFKYKTYQDTLDLYNKQLTAEQQRRLKELEERWNNTNAANAVLSRMTPINE